MSFGFFLKLSIGFHSHFLVVEMSIKPQTIKTETVSSKIIDSVCPQCKTVYHKRKKGVYLGFETVWGGFIFTPAFTYDDISLF